jgi:hypothetical protein
MSFLDVLNDVEQVGSAMFGSGGLNVPGLVAGGVKLLGLPAPAPVAPKPAAVTFAAPASLHTETHAAAENPLSPGGGDGEAKLLLVIGIAAVYYAFAGKGRRR